MGTKGTPSATIKNPTLSSIESRPIEDEATILLSNIRLARYSPALKSRHANIPAQSCSSLGKLDPKNEMPVTVCARSQYKKLDTENLPEEGVEGPTAINLLARLGRIRPLLITNKRKPLRPPRLAILGQENPRHPPKPFEDLTQILLLGELRDLDAHTPATISPPDQTNTHSQPKQTHIRNPQRRQIIPLILPPHPLPLRLPPLPQMRRHIPPPPSPQPPLPLPPPPILSRIPPPHRPLLPHRRHRILKRTARRKMLPITNPTLNLLIPQLSLQIALPARPAIRPLFRLGLRRRLPVHPRLERDVLAHAGGVEARAGGVPFFEPELRPLSAGGHARVDGFVHDGGAYAAGGFELFAGVVEAVGGYGFGAVFVGADLLGGEGAGVVEVFVVGPVGAAEGEISRARDEGVGWRWDGGLRHTWLVWTL